MNGVCNIAHAIVWWVVTQTMLQIAHGGSKSGVGACLYNQQQNNMLKLEKECWKYKVLFLALGYNLVKFNFA